MDQTGPRFGKERRFFDQNLIGSSRGVEVATDKFRARCG
jgi:hypothetical protein